MRRATRLLSLLLLLTLCPQPLSAAWGYTGVHAAVVGVGAAPSMNSTGMDLCVLGIGEFNSASGVAVTDSVTGCPSPCNTWHSLTAYSSTSGQAQIWWSRLTTAGTSHVVSLAASSYFGAFAVACFSGSNASQTPGDHGGTSGSASTLQASSGLGTSGDLVVSAFESGGASSFPTSINSSFSQTDDVAGVGGTNYPISLAYKAVSGSENPTWTASASSELATALANFAGTGGGGGCSAPPSQLTTVGVGNCRP